MSFPSVPGKAAGRHAHLRRAAAAASSLVFLAMGCQDLLDLGTDPTVPCQYSDRYCKTGNGKTCFEDTDCGAEACINGYCQGAGKIAAGGATTCAILAGGVPWCWGLNTQGQCGQIHEIPTHGGDALWLAPPVQAWPAPVMLPDSVQDIAVGGDEESGHACALTDGGEVWCWGANSFSEADATERGQSWVIPNRIDLPAEIAKVEHVLAGHGRTCVFGRTSEEEGNRLWCWGDNRSGQTVPGGSPRVITPTSPISWLVGVTQVALGRNHTCALAGTSLYCWGEKAALPCGGSSDPYDPPMVKVPIAGSTTIRGIAAGDSHTCIATDFGVHCWGEIVGGVPEIDQCFQSPSTSPSTCCKAPTPVAERDLGAAAGAPTYRIAAGGAQTCVSWPSGDVECWDRDDDRKVVLKPPYEHLGAAELALGSRHTCARQAGAEIRCWGYNEYGQLGLGEASDPQEIPTEKPDRPVKYYESSLED